MTRACLIVMLVAACGADTAVCPSDDYSATPAGRVEDVRTIITTSCALGGCHLGAPGAGNLTFDVSSPAWTAAIVDVPAEEAEMNLVEPGDPSASWLVHKIDGPLCGASCTQLGCGGMMPVGSSLSRVQRDAIIGWIRAGAPSR